MANLHISFKQIQIDKAGQSVLRVLIVATILTVFAIIGSKDLVGQLNYRNRVIGAKKAAVDQLRKNIDSVNSLEAAYKAFDESPESIIGTADRNSKIVLDALPSKYDFPALTSSLEKLLTGYKIEAITGSDQEVEQKSVPGSEVVEIPFDITVSSSYDSIQKLISDFDRSIRPLHILSMTISGSDSSITLKISAKTYYQAENKLDIKLKEIE